MEDTSDSPPYIHPYHASKETTLIWGAAVWALTKGRNVQASKLRGPNITLNGRTLILRTTMKKTAETAI